MVPYRTAGILQEVGETMLQPAESSREGKGMEEMKDRIQIATCDILRDYLKKRDVDKMDVFSQPDTEVVEDILKKVFTQKWWRTS